MDTLTKKKCQEIAELQLQHFKHICPAVFKKSVCDKFAYLGDQDKFFHDCVKHVKKTCQETPP